jgi:hypothetical protein
VGVLCSGEGHVIPDHVVDILRKFIYLTEFKFPKFLPRAEKKIAAMACMNEFQ